MSLVQDDYMVQAFTADTPDQPFDIGVLPRTSGGNQHFFDAHVPHPLPKGSAVDPIAVAEEIPRGLVPWECFHDLLGRPCGGGMLSDVEMYETSSLMGQDEQDKQYFVAYRRHNKEIQGH
jgi:hypothetical protein